MEENSSDSSSGLDYTTPVTQSPPPESCCSKGLTRTSHLGVPDPISSVNWGASSSKEQFIPTSFLDSDKKSSNSAQFGQIRNIATHGGVKHNVVSVSKMTNSGDSTKNYESAKVAPPIPSQNASLDIKPSPEKNRCFSFSQLKQTTEEIDDLCSDGEDRKMKRLERNRESARLSRRRRKQYLEVLEDRVIFLCQEMDKGRRDHVLSALQVYKQLRQGVLDQIQADLKSDESMEETKLHQKVIKFSTTLSYMSPELLLATTFGREYLKSLVISPSKKFILWLTLQNDVYFRGGRAMSERLSAARIGEKVCLHALIKCLNRFWNFLTLTMHFLKHYENEDVKLR